jgi:hypothetical protein
MKYTGKLEFQDLGAGQWVLRTDHGITSLFGDIDKSLEGKDVVVEGHAEEGVSSSMASHDAILVRSIRAR